MSVTHEMSLRDAFYACVLDEIRCQPNLQNELGGNELGGVVLAAFGRGLERVCQQIEQAHTGLPLAVITGPGLAWFGRLSRRRRAFSVRLRRCFPSSSAPTTMPCAGALLHLFWGQLEAAEGKVNAAKNNHDDRAFAHHVYGLLRGLQEDRESALFELALASAREGFPGARHRISRALQLVV